MEPGKPILFESRYSLDDESKSWIKVQAPDESCLKDYGQVMDVTRRFNKYKFTAKEVYDRFKQDQHSVQHHDINEMAKTFVLFADEVDYGVRLEAYKPDLRVTSNTVASDKALDIWKQSLKEVIGYMKEIHHDLEDSAMRGKIEHAMLLANRKF